MDIRNRLFEEIEFFTLIREQGMIRPELIIEDKQLTGIVERHPAIVWMTKKISKEENNR